MRRIGASATSKERQRSLRNKKGKHRCEQGPKGQRSESVRRDCVLQGGNELGKDFSSHPHTNRPSFIG